MDTIRIGNDVQVVLGISSFENVNPKNVVSATCIFIKNDEKTQVPTIHELPQYTIHNCNDLCYNVYPCNNSGRHCSSDPCNCGFVVNRPKEVKYVAKCIVRDNSLYAVFPAEFQKVEGKYDCKFEIKVYEKGWDLDNVHMQTLQYDKTFMLSKDDGKTGSITIHINPELVDTWVLACTDEELTSHDPDYSHLIAEAQSFKLYSNEVYYKDISIGHSGNRIVVISSRKDLRIDFSLFKLPVKVYTTDDAYIYVSEYTYGEPMRIKIYATGINNDVINTTPGGTTNGGPNHKPEQPDGPIEDNPDVPEDQNVIDGNMFILFGTLDEQKVLIVPNEFNNNTLIL